MTETRTRKSAARKAPATKRTTKRSATSRLTRRIQRMPAFVKRSLGDRGLMQAYLARPAYQRNDYLGWITSAKLEVTQQKRLNQMLAELASGGRYMKMKWSPAQ